MSKLPAPSHSTCDALRVAPSARRNSDHSGSTPVGESIDGAKEAIGGGFLERPSPEPATAEMSSPPPLPPPVQTTGATAENGTAASSLAMPEPPVQQTPPVTAELCSSPLLSNLAGCLDARVAGATAALLCSLLLATWACLGGASESSSRVAVSSPPRLVHQPAVARTILNSTTPVRDVRELGGQTVEGQAAVESQAAIDLTDTTHITTVDAEEGPQADDPTLYRQAVVQQAQGLLGLVQVDPLIEVLTSSSPRQTPPVPTEVLARRADLPAAQDQASHEQASVRSEQEAIAGGATKTTPDSLGDADAKAIPVSLRRQPPAVCSTTPDDLQRFGTAIEWAESIESASRLAADQGKLLFVMHVSGNFAIPEFT